MKNKRDASAEFRQSESADMGSEYNRIAGQTLWEVIFLSPGEREVTLPVACLLIEKKACNAAKKRALSKNLERVLGAGTARLVGLDGFGPSE